MVILEVCINLWSHASGLREYYVSTQVLAFRSNQQQYAASRERQQQKDVVLNA